MEKVAKQKWRKGGCGQNLGLKSHRRCPHPPFLEKCPAKNIPEPGFYAQSLSFTDTSNVFLEPPVQKRYPFRGVCIEE